MEGEILRVRFGWLGHLESEVRGGAQGGRSVVPESRGGTRGFLGLSICTKRMVKAAGAADFLSSETLGYLFRMDRSRVGG